MVLGADLVAQNNNVCSPPHTCGRLLFTCPTFKQTGSLCLLIKKGELSRPQLHSAFKVISTAFEAVEFPRSCTESDSVDTQPLPRTTYALFGYQVIDLDHTKERDRLQEELAHEFVVAHNDALHSAAKVTGVPESIVQGLLLTANLANAHSHSHIYPLANAIAMKGLTVDDFGAWATPKATRCATTTTPKPIAAGARSSEPHESASTHHQFPGSLPASYGLVTHPGAKDAGTGGSFERSMSYSGGEISQQVEPPQVVCPSGWGDIQPVVSLCHGGYTFENECGTQFAQIPDGQLRPFLHFSGIPGQGLHQDVHTAMYTPPPATKAIAVQSADMMTTTGCAIPGSNVYYPQHDASLCVTRDPYRPSYGSPPTPTPQETLARFDSATHALFDRLGSRCLEGPCRSTMQFVLQSLSHEMLIHPSVRQMVHHWIQLACPANQYLPSPTSNFPRMVRYRTQQNDGVQILIF